MAPRPKKLDEKQMLSLAQVGCTNEEIASHFECSADTIERRYAGVLKKGRAQLCMSLRRQQVKKALDGDNTMLIWLGKIILGQREVTEIHDDRLTALLTHMNRPKEEPNGKETKPTKA